MTETERIGDRGAAVVRVPEAARRLGLTTLAVYLRIDAGRIPARRDEHGMVVVPLAALDTPGN